MPPRDPNGRSSLCRSSCTTCSGISKVVSAGLRGGRPVASRVTCRADRQIALEMRGRDATGRRRNCRSCRRRSRRRAAATSRRWIEREQIADGVAVLGAIEAMHGADPARIRRRRPRPIDVALRASAAIDRAVAASGRGRPAGGIEPARSRAITFSRLPDWYAAIAASTVSSASPAVLSRWLWQVTQ